MALYSIYNDTCLGWSHSGPVNVESDGFVELSDEEVTKIVELIRKEGTSDIEELKLEEIYPDIYKKLNDAFFKMAYDAEEMHWLWEGFYNHYYEYDSEKLMAYCAENCGFNFEYDEEDYIVNGELDEDALEDYKIDVFEEWLDDYVKGLDDEEARKFLKEHMNADVNIYDDEVYYDVTIPEAIIQMAKKKE
ncbi:MAG: hypothetical protein IK100_11825 [Muribaculaceae bacterium]|nr:hypothetical protein [Muribaculaceae bacterium]